MLKAQFMSEPDTCPQCGCKYSNFGVLKANVQISDATNKLINEYSEPAFPYRCTKCGDALLGQCLELLRDERSRLTSYLESKLSVVPIVSSHNPLHWDYHTIGLVTAHSTLGTGIFSDIASSFADLFGAQSKAYNTKIKASEDLCQSLLRIKTLEAGGDAVLAADIDYAEVAGGKGLIMVCMTGTAIKLNNPSDVSADLEANSEMLRQTTERLRYLRDLYSE